MGTAPDTYRYAVLDRIFNFVKGKKVFISHGIAASKPTELFYPKAKIDLFVCSTVAEYEDVLKNYGHPEGVVQRLGLCRFDNLFSPHQVKRQILIMPTWRYHLRTMSEMEFKQSQYYKNFNGLLNDADFLKLLEIYDMEVKFYLHYELQSYSPLFNSASSRVKIATMGDSDVQELLMESILLITDYSSVYYDFAYMNKPVIYWQFDQELFYSTQYERGCFNFKEEGFGPVFESDDLRQIIDFIEVEAKNNMELLPNYEERIKRCFAEQTSDHCENTYRAIKKLMS